MSSRKKVTFAENKNEINRKEHSQRRRKGDYYEENRADTHDDDDDDDDEDDDHDEDQSNKQKPKHSLDSDEEDDNRDRYKALKRDALREIEEAKTYEFYDDIKLTPFNMKEELEEGNFDRDGYFHWKGKDKDEIHDAWLDNIDWNNVNTFKSFKTEKYKLNETETEQDKPINEIESNENQEDADDDNEDEDEDITEMKNNDFNQIEIFKEILKYLKPNENILQAIKRLGKSNTSKSSASLSASQRWLKKKTDTQTTANLNEDKVKEDAIALEKLTSLANKFIDFGYYDIYDETYENLNLKINQNSNKIKQTNDQFDIFAENVDESSFKKETTNINETQIEDKIVKWVYKLINTEESKIHGPFTSEQMLKMSSDGTFKETGVWCRKVDDKNASFYNSKRIDFDLYT